MNSCNTHNGCKLLSIDLPQFSRPQNLPLVEHILRLMIEDGFGEYAYFEGIADDQPLVAKDDEIGDELIERSGFGSWAFHTIAKITPLGDRHIALRDPGSIVKSFLKRLIAPLRPRGSPSNFMFALLPWTIWLL